MDFWIQIEKNTKHFPIDFVGWHLIQNAVQKLYRILQKAGHLEL